MAAPTPGDIAVNFNRTYIVVNPNAALGPPTYRVSNPDEIAGPGGGGSDPNSIKGITGVAPVDVDTNLLREAEISIDLQQLDDRTT